MKRLLQFLVILSVFVLRAQEFTGIAHYTSITVSKNVTMTVEGIDPATAAKIKEMMEKPVENSYIMAFNKTESVYEEEQRLQSPENGREARASLASPFGKQYKNVRDKILIRESETSGKNFIISDTLEKHDWKLLNETKKIGNYTCYKATYTITFNLPVKTEAEKKKEEEENKKAGRFTIMSSMPAKEIVVTAWYTPEIPVSHGPARYWGLPGLILEVNDGSTTLLCDRLVINPKEKPEVKPPSKGKKVTQEEYSEMMRKRMEQMPESGSRRGSSTFTIRG